MKFPKISKDLSSLSRLDKISILEYFNLVDERKYARPNEILIKEVIDFMNSYNFEKEFKFTISDENRRIKFLILNIGLLLNRIENVQINGTIYNHLNYFSILKLKFLRLKLIFCFKYFPMKYHCSEILKYYLRCNQIDSRYKDNYILENEFMKSFNKKDFSFSIMKRLFVKDLDCLESTDNVENFKKIYLIKFLLHDKESNYNQIEVDKLYLYFIAHVIFN